MPDQKALISWSFPEYTIPDRKKSWYVWAAIIFIALLLYAVLTANFLFGLIIIMITIIMFIYHQRESSLIQFAVTPRGIGLGARFYEFNELKKFWLVYDPPAVKNLYLDFKSSIKPTLVVPLQNQNPVRVRKILKEYLEEDLNKEGEGALEALERVLKL